MAAAAVTFFDAGEIDETAAFAMIIGSRLGAAFIVLLLGPTSRPSSIPCSTMISLLVLVLVYDRYEQAMLAAVDWITARRANLAIFVAVLVALPVALLLLSIGSRS